MFLKISLLSTFYFVYFLSVGSCWLINNVNFESSYVRSDLGITELETAELKFSLIYPGTKWCGAGNISKDYDDLGSLVDTDKCCREHDYCPDFIDGGDTKYNLTNTAIYTRLHCDCDEKFRACLRNVSSTTSSIIGKMYFNAINTKCYREDYNVTGCNKRGGWLNKKCLEYTYDIESEKYYQWFDIPNY